MRKFFLRLFVIFTLSFQLSALSCLSAEFTPLDLSPYSDNNGIASEKNPSEGSFDSGEFSYDRELLPGAGTIQVRGIPFLFPDKTKNKNNIACNGQEIKIRPGVYNAILILGSSSNGDYEENLSLRFADGSISTLKLGLTDWCRDPAYGEIPAFSFSSRIGSQGKTDIPNFIWLKTLRIKETGSLSSIILPNNKNMHIFAITLASGDVSSLPKTGTQPGENPKDYTLHLVGHAHIDMNWLWLWPETVQVCKITFTGMLKRMEDYPGFKFSQSQASTYVIMEEKYPEIFDSIKKRVKSGDWEITGGTWTEGDMNMASGEAITRQILYAKRYFKQKFGVDVEICWSPDTFGHAWTIPQILAKSGIKYYYFCRCGKNKPLFWWESPDGSRVLAYNWEWYNSEIKPNVTKKALSMAKKAGVKDFMVVYGVGDHGGGPRKEDVEKAIEYDSNPGYPRLKFSTAKDFFRAAEKESDHPVVNGELNFTFEGCYTTHADIKKYNRVLENLLPAAEMFSAAAMGYGRAYPQDAFTDAWRKTCFNQFHDIFDGSAIHGSYSYSKKLFNAAYETASLALGSSLKAICSGIKFNERAGIPLVVFNPLAWQRDDVAEAKIPAGYGSGRIKIFDGKTEIPSQVTGIEENEEGSFLKVIFIARNVPPAGYKTFYAVFSATDPSRSISGRDKADNLENQYYKILIDPLSGCITGIYDKESKLELVPQGEKANVFQLLFEKPHDMSAWNIGPISRTENLDSACTISLIENGPVRTTAQVCRKYGDSAFCQNIVLYDSLRRIDFPCRVDWQEQGTKLIDGPMLKVAFPVAISGGSARFEIPFGSIQRNANGHEYPSQKWMDLSGAADTGFEYGAGLLNDGKYGCDVKNGVMRLTLLRSSYDPDPKPDKGMQEFTYSLYPHKDGWDARTVKAGYELNNPFICRVVNLQPLTLNLKRNLAETYSFVSVEPENLIVTAFKKAEDSNDMVLRFYECEGKEATAEIKLGFPAKEAWETGLMENNLAKIALKDGKISVKTGKYEVKTVRIIRQ